MVTKCCVCKNWARKAEKGIYFHKYCLYKAYWCMIIKDENTAFKLLGEGSDLAKKCGVLYDIDWIEHTRQLWMQPRNSNYMDDAWQIASDKEDMDFDWNSCDSSDITIPFFSLCLPMK